MQVLDFSAKLTDEVSVYLTQAGLLIGFEGYPKAKALFPWHTLITEVKEIVTGEEVITLTPEAARELGLPTVSAVAS